MNLVSNDGNVYKTVKIQNHKMPNLLKWGFEQKPINGIQTNVFFKDGSGSYFILDSTNYYVADKNFKFESGFKTLTFRLDRPRPAVNPNPVFVPRVSPSPKKPSYKPVKDRLKRPTDLYACSRAFNETNDCTVVATAIVGGMSYEQAHREMSLIGRRPRKGHYFQSYISDCAMFGKTFAGKTFRRVHLYGSVSKVLNSLDETKTYYVFIRGHVFAVRNGIMYDGRPTPKKNVQGVFEVL